MNIEAVRAAFPMAIPRPGQLEAAKAVLDAWETVDDVILSAPTGSGKTALAITIARLRKPAIYTSPLTSLVLQVAGTPELERYVATFMGARNYQCKQFLANCDQKLCDLANNRDGENYDCLYSQVKNRAAFAQIINTTFHGLLNNHDYLVERGGPRACLIVDEAHRMTDALVSNSTQEIPDTLWPFPDMQTTEEYTTWIQGEQPSILNEINSLASEIGRKYAPIPPAKVWRLRELRALNAWSVIMQIDKSVTWAHRIEERWDHKRRRLIRTLAFVPIQVRRLVARDVQPLAGKRLYMSATPPTVGELGLDPEKVKVIEVPSTFPVSHRPVIVDCLGKMGYKDREANIGKVAAHIATVGRRVKTLIHAPSYAFAARLGEEIDKIDPNCYMLLDRTDRVGSLERWKVSDVPIFIAVGMTDGIDLPDDLCRCTIFPVVPWLDRNEVVTKKRLEEEGDEWYVAQTARTIIQGCGRSVRSENDFSVAYILDSNVNMLLGRAREIGALPKWWSDAIIWKKTKLPKQLKKVPA